MKPNSSQMGYPLLLPIKICSKLLGPLHSISLFLLPSFLRNDYGYASDTSTHLYPASCNWDKFLFTGSHQPNCLYFAKTCPP